MYSFLQDLIAQTSTNSQIYDDFVLILCDVLGCLNVSPNGKTILL